MRIIHLTSVHLWDDIRIFRKMCCSLSGAGYEVHLVAPRSDTSAIECCEGVMVHPIKPAKNRLERMTCTVRACLNLGISLKGDVYHFHDPEFLRFVPALERRLKKPFIYDVHEDYRRGIQDKAWIPLAFRTLISRCFALIEDKAASNVSGIISATPSIGLRFSSHMHHVTVQNFPLKHEMLYNREGGAKVPGMFVYAGVISIPRGLREMLQAVKSAGPEFSLALAGPTDSCLQEEELAFCGERQLHICGVLKRDELLRLFARACAGLVLFHPLANHINAQPNKLFEYMAAGLPVIVSDFPLWRAIIEDVKCGILVNPLDPKAIADAMWWIKNHPNEACEMGRRGADAVRRRYNWDMEFPKLIKFYTEIVY